MPVTEQCNTNPTLAAIRRLVDGLEDLDVAIRHDHDMPTCERIDGGIRWRMNARTRDARIAVERLRREWTEMLAELQRVEQESDAVAGPQEFDAVATRQDSAPAVDLGDDGLCMEIGNV